MFSTAAAVYYGSRCFAGGIISRITNLEMNKQVTVEAVFTFTSYDETPMVVRAARAQAGAKADATPATSKLLQSEVEFGILTRHGERYDLSLLSLPCPVHLLQRGTGEALKASLDELIDDIPFLHSLQTVNANVFVCGVSAADRAQANNKAENGIYIMSGPVFVFDSRALRTQRRQQLADNLGALQLIFRVRWRCP